MGRATEEYGLGFEALGEVVVCHAYKGTQRALGALNPTTPNTNNEGLGFRV